MHSENVLDVCGPDQGYGIHEHEHEDDMTVRSFECSTMTEAMLATDLGPTVPLL